MFKGIKGLHLTYKLSSNFCKTWHNYIFLWWNLIELHVITIPIIGKNVAFEIFFSKPNSWCYRVIALLLKSLFITGNSYSSECCGPWASGFNSYLIPDRGVFDVSQITGEPWTGIKWIRNGFFTMNLNIVFLIPCDPIWHDLQPIVAKVRALRFDNGSYFLLFF